MSASLIAARSGAVTAAATSTRRMKSICAAATRIPACAPGLGTSSWHLLPASLAPRRRDVAARVIIRSRVERTDDDIQEVLFTQEQLNEILDDLGRQIGHDYHDKDLLVLGVLKGGFMFTSDLIRHVNPVPKSMEVDFFKAASYGLGVHSTGRVTLDDAFDLSIVKDRHVLVTEDIIDTGLTMASIVSLLRSAGAMSVRVAVLLDKRARRNVTFDADYVGIVCPDVFVVGYGIDFAERYRWLPYIGVPKPEVVESLVSERRAQEERLVARMEARNAQRAAATAARQQAASPPLSAAVPAVRNPGGLLSSVVTGNGRRVPVCAGNGRTALLPKPSPAKHP